MASEAITRNDLTAILNEVLPSGLKCHTRKSNNISVSVAANAKGSVNYTFSEAEPAGVRVSRGFMRTDNGGYNITIDTPLYANYLVYQSLGSAPTLTGYVQDIYIESA